MGVRLTVIGCAGSFPGPHSPASCYLVEHEDHRIVLDLGNGSLGALQRYADLDSLDAVALSHLHADHCLDLCGLYVFSRYHPDGPRERVPVFGPSGTAARMAAAYDMPVDPGMSTAFDFRDYSAPVDIGPFQITTARVRHPVEAYALRVEAGGRTLVYSGDTGPTPVLAELAAGADLALFEASLLDGREAPDVHMTARDAGTLAAEADVRRLVLTHLVPWHDPRTSYEEAREAFAGPLSVAESGLVIDLA